VIMRKLVATFLRKLSKLADWLDPQPTATIQGGGGTGPRQ